MVVAFAVAAVACGGGEEAPPVRPAKVPEGLIPESVLGGEFSLFEATSDQVKNAFANAGSTSLAADGRMWELRKGDRLVGALQLTTLLPEVDLTKEDHRNQILGQLMPTSRDQILIDEVNVWTATINEKTIYLWFAKDMYAMLTIKGGSEDQLDTEGILTDVVTHNVASDDWKPLFIDDLENI